MLADDHIVVGSFFILDPQAGVAVRVCDERPAEGAVEAHQLCAGAHGVHAALQVLLVAGQFIQVEQRIDVPCGPAVRRVHHVRGIAGELHLYVILGFPETQGAAVHAGIRDDGLLVRSVVIHDLERCVRILFALRRPLREHQGKFAELVAEQEFAPSSKVCWPSVSKWPSKLTRLSMARVTEAKWRS